MDKFRNCLLRLLFIPVLSMLNACGSEDTATGEEAPVTLHAPEFAWVGEQIWVELEFSSAVEPYLIFVNDRYVDDASEPVAVTLKTPSDLTEGDCCEISVEFIDQRDGANHQARVIVPTFGPTLYPGAPMTVRAKRETTLAIGVDTGYLTYLNDSVATITWTQQAGPEIDLSALTDGNRKLVLDLPAYDQIERFVFEVTLISSGGLTFTAEKILFAVPEAEWVEATLIAQSDNRSLVYRADGTLAHLGRNSLGESIEYTRAPGPNTKKISVGPDVRDFLLDANGNAYDRNRSQPEWRLQNPDRPITDIQAIQLDVRTGLNVIFENGEAFTVGSGVIDLTNNTALAAGVRKITPSRSQTHLMKDNGELWFDSSLNQENYIADIYDLDLTAYLTEDRRVHSLFTYEVFPGFEEFSDIERIASSNFALGALYVFAWRQNGELVSNARLPLVEGVQHIQTGSDLHLALLEDGTVHLWQSQYNAPNGHLDVLRGTVPSPFNLRAPMQ